MNKITIEYRNDAIITISIPIKMYLINSISYLLKNINNFLLKIISLVLILNINMNLNYNKH